MACSRTMFLSDTESVCSDASSIATSTHSATTSQSRYHTRFIGGGINTRSILNDQFEVITNKYLGSFDYVSMPIAATSLSKGIELLKTKNPPGSFKVPILYDLSSVTLTEEDRSLRPANEDDKDEPEDDIYDTKEVANEFDRYYGTSIAAIVPEDKKPYLDFSQHTSEITAKLDKLLATNQAKLLVSKTSLTEDIEQQFAIQPLRISKRQRKRANAEARGDTLPNWFNMPRVTEITKEQEKDLAALKMRHVWNPKSFYKKSALGGADQSGPDTSKFFQLGTVVEDKSDFYSDRLPKKQRKQTIVDELMHDQEARANQKRKMASVMAQGRQKMLQMRQKQRRQKAKIKSRKDAAQAKAAGFLGTARQVNKFKTSEV